MQHVKNRYIFAQSEQKDEWLEMAFDGSAIPNTIFYEACKDTVFIWGPQRCTNYWSIFY